MTTVIGMKTTDGAILYTVPAGNFLSRPDIFLINWCRVQKISCSKRSITNLL